jgi:putative ABC transport system permease protein
MLDLARDARHTLRMLRRRPVVSVLAILVLALGLGGTITVFSTVDALLLRELPYAESDRLVTLWQTDDAYPDDRSGVAPGVFVDWRAQAKSFGMLAAAEPFSFDYLSGPEPVSVPASLVTEGFFEALGVSPVLGRLFLPAEYGAGEANVVLLSYAAWQGRFGGDERVVGTAIVLEGQQYVVAGVLPRSFHADLTRRSSDAVPYREELWAPKVIREPERANRNSRYWSVVARLAPGVTLDEARAELATISGRLAAEHRSLATMTATLVPAREHVAAPLRDPMTLLLAGVVMMLLIACCNVASLLVVRGVEREREFAVRAAIGAARRQLVRQTLVEAAVLTAIAWALGLAIAFAAMRAFVGFTSQQSLQLAGLTLDARLIVFAAVLAAATSMLVGLWPAIRLSRGLNGVLRETVAGVTATARGRRFVSGIVIGEVALALVLLIGTGLLVRSFLTVAGVDPGFARSNIALVQVFTYGPRYQTDAQRRAFFDQVLDRFRAEPGVVRAGLVSAMPFMPSDIDVRGPFRAEGNEAQRDDELPTASLTVATSEYFEALDIALQGGRLFSAADHGEAAPVAVVNDLFAERAWPGQDPLGRRIAARWQGRWLTMEVVGVVARVRHNGLESEPRPELFMPHAQLPFGSMTFVVETSIEPAAAMPALKAHIWALDSTLPLWDTATLDSLVADSLGPRRFVVQIVGLVSGLAFVLSVIGVYGMLSFSTVQRTREIGLRVAMGASESSIMKMVIREGMTLVVIGAVIGLAAALMLSRAISALLYGVSATDPATIAVTTATVVAVALAACYVPARRATRVDPLAALRAE